MAMKFTPPDDDFPAPLEEKSKGSTGIDNTEPEAVAEDGSLQGFLARFLTSQGVTADGLLIPYRALYPAAAKAIKEIATIKCVSEGMVFGQFLSLLSIAGRTRCVRYRNDWREHGNLYLIVVADSGGGKTHSMNYIFKDVSGKEAVLKAQYKAERDKYEHNYKQWARRKKGDESPEPIAPEKTRYLVKDSTMAGLVETFQTNPRGLLWQINEMGGFFAGLDGHSKTGATEAKRKLLDAYDCQELSADRRSKDGMSQDYYVPAAGLSMYGHVQSDLLGEVFTERDLYIGMDARFLFVRARRGIVPFAHDNEISDETAGTIAKVSEYLLGLELHKENGLTYPVDVELSSEARTVFKTFYDVLMQTTSGDPIEEAFALKMAGQTLRVSLLLHLLVNALSPCRYDTITADTMRGAQEIILWSAWNLRQLWPKIPGGKGVPGQEAQVFRALEFVKSHMNFASEWHTTGEIIKQGLAWHGPDTASQAKNLGGFLTPIIASAIQRGKIKEDDVKGKKNGLMKYRLSELRGVLEDLDNRAG